MSSQRLFQGHNPLILACFKLKRGVNFTHTFPKLMGSGTHCSKLDVFVGTHANGAIVEIVHFLA